MSPTLSGCGRPEDQCRDSPDAPVPSVRHSGRIRSPRFPKDSTMQPPSADQLIILVTQCDESSEEERDELLRAFLVQAYPTRQTQNG